MDRFFSDQQPKEGSVENSVVDGLATTSPARQELAEACGSRTHPSRLEAATPTDLKSARVTGPRALPDEAYNGLSFGLPLAGNCPRKDNSA